MAKYEEISDYITEMVNEHMSARTLERYISFKVIASNTQKKEVVKPIKATDIVKYHSKIDLFVLINEGVFENLPEEMQRLSIENALTGVVFNTEKETLIVEKPDFVAHGGFLEKYGNDTHIKLVESIKSAFDKKKDDAKKLAEGSTTK